MDVRNNMQNVAFKQNLLFRTNKKSPEQAVEFIENLIKLPKAMGINKPAEIIPTSKNQWIVPDLNTQTGRVIKVIADNLEMAKIHRTPPSRAIIDILDEARECTKETLFSDTPTGKILSLIEDRLVWVYSGFEKSEIMLQELLKKAVNILASDNNEVKKIHLDKSITLFKD